jgi:hypothetical protein
MIPGTIKFVRHGDWYPCIVIFASNLESDKWYYSDSVNEMMIPFDGETSCCTVHVQIVISLTACYVGQWNAHKCLSRRPDHILDMRLRKDWIVDLFLIGNLWSLLIVIWNVAETYLCKAMNLDLCRLPATCFFFLSLRWRQHAPPIRRLTFAGPPGVISQNTELLKFRVVHSVNMFSFDFVTERIELSVVQLTLRSKVAAHQLFV